MPGSVCLLPMPRTYWLSIDSLCLGRSFVCLLMAVAVAVLAAPAVVGAVSCRIAESQSPVEAEEETLQKLEEVLVGSQRRFRLRRIQKQPPASQGAVDRSYPASVNPSRFLEGHRLPSGSLAPLTC